MPVKTTITFAGSAARDIEEIRKWDTDQDAARVGERLSREILSAIERPADYPESGRKVPEFGLENLSEIIHPPFRIVYRLDKHKVRIVRIWRSERLLKKPPR